MSTDSRARAVPHSPLPHLQVADLHAGFREQTVLSGVGLDIFPEEILALIGPTGSGKSTFLRCLNRLHERTPRAWVRGAVTLRGVDVYGASVDPALLRRAVGMVASTPNPFPAMSIRDNVLAGLRLIGQRPAPEAAEAALQRAALWDEVKDGLDRPPRSLSLGQQQRLCIARALAVQPEILLLDEPCTALDPIATARIEDLLGELKATLTIVLATHSMQQAARVSDRTALFLPGALVETGLTGDLFTSPRDPRTEDYLTGRYGW